MEDLGWHRANGLRILVVACFPATVSEISKECLRVLAMAGATLFVVVSQHDECGIGRVFLENKLCTEDRILSVDTSCMRTVSKRLTERITDMRLDLDGIVSLWDIAMPLVGDLSAMLTLPGNSQAAYQAVGDKLLTKILCQRANLEMPRFAPVAVRGDLQQASSEVGFPLVLKHRYRAAPNTERRCDTLEEAQRQYDAMQTIAADSAPLYGANGPGPQYVLEEQVPGNEYDIVMVLSRGKVVYSNVTDNVAFVGTSFIGTASICPSELDPEYQEELKAYASGCVNALGLETGVYRASVRTSAPTATDPRGRPLLCEVYVRIGQGHTAFCHKDVYGVDLFLCQSLAACGVDLSGLQVHPAPSCALAVYDVYAPRTGVLMHDRWLDHLKRYPSVVAALTYISAGSTVVGCDTGSPDWLGTVVVKADYPEDVKILIEAMADTIDPPVVPESELRMRQHESRSTGTYYSNGAREGHAPVYIF